jgi:hypothetical protein
MFDKLLIALGLKKKPQPRDPRIEPSTPWPRYAGHVSPRPMPLPAPSRRMYGAPAVAPSPAPAPSDDFASNLLLYSMLSNGRAPAQECRRETEPEPMRSGGGGDFGGGGASGGWEPPSPAPSYEPPAPSPSYDSGPSSSDSSSSSSTSSD